MSCIGVIVHMDRAEAMTLARRLCQGGPLEETNCVVFEKCWKTRRIYGLQAGSRQLPLQLLGP